MRIRAFSISVTVAITALYPAARAEPILCAVAANFTPAARDIFERFEKRTGHGVAASFGSTGQLYAQIVNGAPFQVFMAADQTRPARLENQGLAVPGTRFTYAVGTLVLWSSQPGAINDGERTLRSSTWTWCAIANPRSAPYGAAAVQTLRALGLYETIRRRLVRGMNIAHAWQQVARGNAHIGFVALSQIALLPPRDKGSHWAVPPELYPPLLQQAQLLRKGETSLGARLLLEFLRTKEIQAVIRAYGYTIGHI
jgi:molybdate transport system substrate-binding protein